MHTAISATPILNGRKEQIDAILIHAGQLLLAGPNSSITAYNLPQKGKEKIDVGDERSIGNTSSSNNTNQQAQITKPAWIARLSKSTKSIEQLKVIKEANVFVTLSDQTVALHDVASIQETGKQYSSKKVDANASLLPSAPLIPSEASTTLIQTKGAISLSIDTSIQPTPNTNNGPSTSLTQRGGAGYRHQAGQSTIGRAYRPSDMSIGRAAGAGAGVATNRSTNRPMSLLGMEELKREREQKRKYMTMQARTGFIREEEKTSSTEGAAESGVSVVTTLAVGCRRKLIVFRWVDGAFWDTKEIHLPHTPRTLAFPTPEKLFMGYTSSEYAILTIPLAATSSVADLMESGPSLKPVEIPSSSLAGTRVDLYEWKFKTLEIPLVGSFDGSTAEGGTASDQGGSEADQKQTSTTAAATGSGMTAMAGAAFTGLTGYMGMAGNKNKPLVLQIEDGEVLVCRESMGVFLNEEGRPTRRDGIDWTVVPEEVLYVKPYVLSILPPSGRQLPASPLLQVRSASTLVAVQTLPFPPATEVSSFSIKAGNYPSVRHLTSSTGNKPPLYVKVTPTERGALEKDGSSIWCLEMKSWGKQVDELVEAGEFQEALALLNSVDEILLEDKQERRTYIESLYAVSLFSKGQYSDAIDHFLELDTNPARVIALFPAFIAGPLATERSQWFEMFGAKKKKVESSEASVTEHSADNSDNISIRSGKSLTPGVNIPREQSRLRGLWGRRPQSIVGDLEGYTPGTSPAKASPLKANATIISASPLAVTPQVDVKESANKSLDEVEDSQKKSDLSELPAQPKVMPLPSEDERKAIDALGTFLADRRRIFKPILEQQPSSHSITMSQLRRDPEWLLSLPSQPLSSLNLEQLTAVAQTVDTALFKTFLATKPGLLGPLCRLENWCEVDQVEQLLMGREKYSELIALYGGKEMHDKALQLLRKMSKDVEDIEDKVEPTVRYLQNLGPGFIDLILQTSHWVFLLDEDWGMDIFTGDTGKVSLLPRFAVVKDLESFDEKICIRYLQYLIGELQDGDPSLHEKLAFLLLHRADNIKNKSDDDETSLEMRKKALADLLEHLESSHQYRAERVLNRVPTEERDFYDVRALLLGRIGQDEAALRIYVDKLGDHSKAEEYCKRIIAQNPSSNAFLTLLRIYLRPKEFGKNQSQKKSLSYDKQSNTTVTEMQLEPALRIISRYGAKVDAKAALDLLPTIVPLSAVESFACKSLRQTYAQKNEEIILSRIAKERLLQTDETLMTLHRRRVKVTETRTCPRCMKRLGNSVIAVTSEGLVFHYGCSKFSN